MRDQFLNVPLIKNEENKRFEIQFNNSLAFIDYKETSTTIALIHTEAAEELAGTGATAALVEKTLMNIRDSGKLIAPYCPYVYAFILKNPQWKKYVSPSFPKYKELMEQA
ncbi:GNAT family N-acetyltransferase [Sphingobacterium sp. HJSM2_6]|uniref:GNAT family N-acetyltransferase n=1 Tax=Sphingobacterium sp. HJSM2_6 TaxID=3366264 RepID=UPI003BC86064